LKIGYPHVAATLSALAVLDGCAVGPNYHRPSTALPSQYGSSSAGASGATTKPTSTTIIDPAREPWSNWWTQFGDVELDTLIDRAVWDNHGLKVAAARVTQARAASRIAQAAQYPDVSIGAGFAKSRGSSAGLGFPYGDPSKDNSLFQLGFDAAYEVDLFGGVRRSIEAAGANAELTENLRRAVQLSLIAEVAHEYILLRTLQRRLDIARQNLADQQHTLRVVQKRLNNGLSAEFDLVRARAEVEATESNIPPLESGIRQTIYGLSVLAGRPPQDLEDELLSRQPVPISPKVVPIGLPSELLRRRPDVMAAEQALAAATAEEGVAIAELFPHIDLVGTTGLQATRIGNLFAQHGPSSGFYLAGPAMHWTIFDGGRRLANIDMSKAVVSAATAEYEQTVLAALRDVDSALTALSHDQKRRDALTTVVTDADRAVRIARDEYTNGLVDLLDVLEVQRSLYAAQDSLAQADLAVSNDLISLFKALGGGWETGSSPQPAAQLMSRDVRGGTR
jgi:multidrug efflux system outer membrane protein